MAAFVTSSLFCSALGFRSGFRLGLRSGALAFGLGLGLLLGSGCFTPPSDDVLFSCELDGDDKCPPDYRCEADNCCHRIGSDVDANLGDCALGGGPGGDMSDSSSDTESDGSDGAPGMDTGTG